MKNKRGYFSSPILPLEGFVALGDTSCLIKTTRTSLGSPPLASEMRKAFEINLTCLCFYSN